MALPRLHPDHVGRAAVFLDRDDTLIGNRAVTAGTAHPGDLFEPGLVRLLPGVGEGLARLKGAGYLLIVVSNQGAVARGRCTIADVEATNARMRELVRAESGGGWVGGGVELDAVYFCPYHPAGVVAPFNVEHPWRKPAPGMILHAIAEHGIDVGGSWMIGDALRDIDAAVAAGVPASHSLLLGSEGFGEAVEVILRRKA